MIRGWRGDVYFGHPSALCQQVANGELDVALVSSFEFLRNPIYQIVDDISISSDGPVYSVVVAYRGELLDIEEIELDPASETSVNLLRSLLAELGLFPRLTFGSNTSALPCARLIIGDQAIHFRQSYAGQFQFWDLGEQWKKLTGLPFVYALWLIRPEVTDVTEIANRLRALRDENLASLDQLIDEAVVERAYPVHPLKVNREFLGEYYSHNLRFTFREREKQGLHAFAGICAKHGLLPSGDLALKLV